ncbi:MAG: hypothetical protein KBA46_06040 [Candidatus Omnitrophica bacterium]|nr:hypothetical protein [Candidatus Omnitrophota bacterium]
MRDVVFKHLTSDDKRRKRIASCETAEQHGMRSTVCRHFVYIAQEVQGEEIVKPMPYISVRKERNNKGQQEKFFCKIKGSVVTMSNGRMFLIRFMHSLRINLTAVSHDLGVS